MVALRVGGLDASYMGWIGSHTVSPSQSSKKSHAENKATLFHRVQFRLSQWQPALIVIEEPVDVNRSYGKARGVTGQARGTLFTQGEHYGLVLAAAVGIDIDDEKPVVPRVYAYPTNNHNKRPGWMMRGGRVAPRHETLERIRLVAKAIGAPEDVLDDEDVMMALGVLLYHLSERRET